LGTTVSFDNHQSISPLYLKSPSIKKEAPEIKTAQINKKNCNKFIFLV
jgi:hypothetical protein